MAPFFNFLKFPWLVITDSLEKLDAILNSEYAFEKSMIVEDGDYTTECVDKFINVLTSLTERYCNLPQPGHKLQFLQLQLDLLDDFRVRLLQLQREENVSQSSILNSVSGIIFVLEEWNVAPVNKIFHRKTKIVTHFFSALRVPAIFQGPTNRRNEQ